MKIGIDARLWDETGVGRYIRNLILHLQLVDTKNAYTLFLPKKLHQTPFIKDLQAANPTWTFRFIDIPWHTVKEQIVFPKIIAQEKLDLMHFPYFSMPMMYNRPYVITIHDLIINHFPTGKASTLPLPVYYAKHIGYQFLIKQVARHAKKVITVSQATKQEIMTHLNVQKENIEVTYEGVDPLITSDTQKKSKYSPYFLYVGNAYPHKNPEILVPVFKKLLLEFPDVKLLFVGGENYFYKRLEQLVKKNNGEKSLIFLGKVDDLTLSNLYANACALVTPSLMEGFGLPGLEAMKQGCLVLAADIPVYREIYGECAVYFDPHSEEAIHATIRAVLLKEENFKKCKEKGSVHVKNYSWQKLTQQTIAIYESCARL